MNVTLLVSVQRVPEGSVGLIFTPVSVIYSIKVRHSAQTTVCVTDMTSHLKRRAV